jgi:hypothetical protein
MPVSRLLGAIAVLITAASLAHTREEPVPVAPPPRDANPLTSTLRFSTLLPFVSDPAFRADLKLSDDQVKRLITLRQGEWDDAFNTSAVELRARQAEREAALTDSFRTILTEDQFKRTQQLLLQRFWRSGAVTGAFAPASGGPDYTRLGPTVPKSHSALARALDLSGDQLRFGDVQFAGLLRTTILLTPEQADGARKLLGEIRSDPWEAERDPRTAAVHALALTDALEPLRIATTYRSELKITDEQARAIGAPDPVLKSRLGRSSPADALKEARSADLESEKALAKVLSPEQMTRLRQIIRQLEVQMTVANAPEPLVVSLASELKPTAPQLQKFTALRTAHAGAVARALTGEDFGASYRGIRTANSELEKAMLAALTDDQRARIKELVGEPLAGSYTGRSSVARTESLRLDREALFGRYSDELTLLSLNSSLQSELKLTADQTKLTLTSSLEVTKRFGFALGLVPGADRASAADKSKFIEEALAGILDEQQARRFRQLMIQRRERPDSVTPPVLRSGLTYPGVAAELELSADQKKRVIDGDSTAAVLTDEQRRAFKEMLGERFPGDFRPILARFDPAPVVTLPKERDRADFLKVAPWEELKLTPEQHTQLARALNHYQLEVDIKGARVAPGGFGKNPRPKARDDSSAVLAFQTELERILGSGKLTLARLDQLALQSRAAHNLRDALTHPDVSRALKLTAPQRAQLADLEDEAVELGSLVVGSPSFVSGREDNLRRLRDRLEAQMFAVLTAEQRAKWKELIGEPYTGFTKTVIRGPIFRSRSAYPWGLQ